MEIIGGIFKNSCLILKIKQTYYVNQEKLRINFIDVRRIDEKFHVF